MSYGISGIKMTSAVAATPAESAIQPAFRPINSTTITRSCASAVEWSLSIASVAVSTAVRNPKVRFVAAKSLSMVFGTPITFSPFSKSACAIESEPSPPTAISASILCAARVSITSWLLSIIVVEPCSSETCQLRGSPLFVVPMIVPPK